jgi:repressor LexA
VKALSKRQRETLEFIREHIAIRKYAPTQREIADALGVSSLGSVKQHLAALELRGCLRREPGTPRAMWITERGEAAVLS